MSTTIIGPLAWAVGFAGVVLCCLQIPGASADEQSTDPPEGFRGLGQEAAWARLPEAIAGYGAQLPSWALTLADALPGTTAAMLEMDYLQRANSPLDPQLRARLRWVAARANRCAYAEAYAAADYQRAGGKLQDLAATEAEPSPLTERDRRLVSFVQRLCREAYAISDDDVQRLIEDRGAAELTAAVLLTAYANFQDRLLLSLGVEVEENGPLPPVALQFSWDEPRSRPTRVLPPEPAGATAVPDRVVDSRWAAIPFQELRGRLEQQKLRAPRVAIPADEVVEQNMPAGLYPPGQVTAIVWNSITFGYQPRLAGSWIFTLRRFREESSLADDFRQSMFWVVTRTNQCFY